MKLSSFVTLAVLTVSAVSQDAPNVLIYGSVGSQEDQAAIELGYNTTIVTDSEWANMSTLDFARYDAVVVPDPNSGSIISLDFLEKSKDIWSPAITGSIIVIGESTGYLSSRYWSWQAQAAIQWTISAPLAQEYSSETPFALLLPVIHHKGQLAYT
jgi:hypothetical protein